MTQGTRSSSTLAGTGTAALAIAILLVSSGCTTSKEREKAAAQRPQTQEEQARENAEATLLAAVNEDTLSVDFRPGQTLLDTEEVSALRALAAAQPEGAGKINAYIAAWPDVQPPPGQTDVGQQQLVQQRLNEVRDALKNADVDGDIVAMNMTMPNASNRQLLHPKENAIRAAMSGQEGDVKVKYDEVADAFQANAGPGRAVVVLRDESQG